jgi:hypothetical protein
VSAANLLNSDPKSGKEERSMSSETDTTTTFEPPPAKLPKMEDAEAVEDAEAAWQTIAGRCLASLETVIVRFPQHFKALHQVSSYYLRSKKSKDIKKVQRYMWGVDAAAGIRYTRYKSGRQSFDR